MTLLTDAESLPRQRACAAVREGGWRSPDLVGPLTACLADPQAEPLAIQALRVQGGMAADAVPELLRVGVERRHLNAFLACRDLGGLTQPHAEAFRRELRRPEPTLARLAALALRQCAPQWTDAAAVLSAWRDDPCENVRAAAEEVLASLG